MTPLLRGGRELIASLRKLIWVLIAATNGAQQNIGQLGPVLRLSPSNTFEPMFHVALHSGGDVRPGSLAAVALRVGVRRELKQHPIRYVLTTLGCLDNLYKALATTCEVHVVGVYVVLSL